MTVQLATQIDSKAKKVLEKLNKKTHVSIRSLTEQAIFLLDEYYQRLGKTYNQDIVDKAFMDMVREVTAPYDKTMKRLAE